VVFILKGGRLKNRFIKRVDYYGFKGKSYIIDRDNTITFYVYDKGLLLDIDTIKTRSINGNRFGLSIIIYYV
jgi:hypothetical protein